MDCPICGNEIKTIPAGVSKKTGKPYSAFSVCSNSKCNFKPQEEGHTREIRSTLPPKPKNGDPYVEGKEKNNILICRKDLMVCLINTYQVTMGNEDLKNLFNDLWSEIEK